jgi:UDP-N-acetyl-D-mannosaminuronic acid transferase (WecB/TagA/CpsF family)
VGALFDYLADVEPWASQWVRRNGLKWTFRQADAPRQKARPFFPRKWMQLDGYYAPNRCLSLDHVIILKTIPAVLSARGAY